MATRKAKSKDAPSGAPSSVPQTEDATWAIDPVPQAVRTFLKRAAPTVEVDMSALADAFEVYNSTNPAGQMSPAEEFDSIASAIDASKRLRSAVARLSEFARGEMMSSRFGPRGSTFETWWPGVDKDLRDLEQGLAKPAARARELVGKQQKKPKLDARDRLLRAVYQALPATLTGGRRIERAADILEAAKIAVPADTGARRRLLRSVLAS